MRVEQVVTSGTFTLDGGTWVVDNNVWLIGDDDRVLVIDAAHDAGAIAAAVAGREVTAVFCTHAHNDHIDAAPELAELTGAPIWLHEADLPLWRQTHAQRLPDRWIGDGDTVEIAGVTGRVIHTPGHAPGAVCLYFPDLDALFSGDTLFRGGPGATGRSFSDFGTIIGSIRDRLLILPPRTTVYTGHGDGTTVGDEAPALDDWIARGH